LEDLGGSRKTILKLIVKKQDGEVKIGLMWLRIRTGGGLL
jgi:hypothetical protein